MKKKELKKAVEELVEAIRVTQEYALLPAQPGWAWYDALVKYAPDLAEHFRSRYLHPTTVTTGTTTVTNNCTLEGCMCGGTTWITNYEIKDGNEI